MVPVSDPAKLRAHPKFSEQLAREGRHSRAPLPSSYPGQLHATHGSFGSDEEGEEGEEGEESDDLHHDGDLLGDERREVCYLVITPMLSHGDLHGDRAQRGRTLTLALALALP